MVEGGAVDKKAIENLKAEVAEVSFDPFLSENMSANLLKDVEKMNADRPQDKILMSFEVSMNPKVEVLGCFMGKLLGRGGFGAAYLAINKKRTVVKIETFLNENNQPRRPIKQIQLEIDVQQKAAKGGYACEIY